MNGILLIDKPVHWTSFDVVNRVRHIIELAGMNTSGRKRFPVGHTGTLDPLATGLLVLLLGDYTKHALELSKLDKTYDVTMRLGQTSTTGDGEGEKTHVANFVPSQEQVETALKGFEGEIMQTPPAYSAIKINGQRAYKLARAGQQPDMQPRPVRINKIALVKYEYPFIDLITHVSSGTYIRSLVEDVGSRLGTGAYMTSLRRMQVGQFMLADAIAVDKLNASSIEASLRNLDKSASDKS